MFIEALNIETNRDHEWSLKAREKDPSIKVVPPTGARYQKQIGNAVFLYRRQVQRHFKGSKRFPDGVEIGVTERLSQGETGPPFPTHADLDISNIEYYRLKAYADGRTHTDYPTAKKLSKQREQARLTKEAQDNERKGGAALEDKIAVAVQAAIEPLAKANAELRSEVEQLRADKDRPRRRAGVRKVPREAVPKK